MEHDETILVPSNTGDYLNLEENLAPIEIEFDADFLIIEGCNSEGAPETGDMIELDGYDNRGRGSDAGV